jgi:hypothetical protein
MGPVFLRGADDTLPGDVEGPGENQDHGKSQEKEEGDESGGPIGEEEGLGDRSGQLDENHRHAHIRDDGDVDLPTLRFA